MIFDMFDLGYFIYLICCLFHQLFLAIYTSCLPFISMISRLLIKFTVFLFLFCFVFVFVLFCFFFCHIHCSLAYHTCYVESKSLKESLQQFNISIYRLYVSKFIPKHFLKLQMNFRKIL